MSCEPKTETAAGQEGRRETLAECARQFAPAIFFAICLLSLRVAKQLGLGSVSVDLLVLISATVATLLVVRQRLPLQNVFGLAVAITLFSGVVFLVENILMMSFTPVLNAGFQRLPAWTVPLLWIISLVNARGVAKFFLQKIRRTKNFGLWLIGLSSLLVVMLNRSSQSDWQIVLGQFVLALVAFVMTTPWFIDKKPAERGPDNAPLVLTLLILFW